MVVAAEDSRALLEALGASMPPELAERNRLVVLVEMAAHTVNPVAPMVDLEQEAADKAGLAAVVAAAAGIMAAAVVLFRVVVVDPVSPIQRTLLA